MRLDWLGHPKVSLTPLQGDFYISYTLTSATIVVEKLVLGYDVNYGARSVMNKVKTLAIQKIAESQIRGDIRKK